MTKNSILILLFYFSCSPKKIKLSTPYQNAFEHFLLLKHLRIDSSKVEFIMNNYIDSFKLNSDIFKQYVTLFDSDLELRERILKKIVEKQDTTILDSSLKRLFKDTH